jgi:hypothetical protein
VKKFKDELLALSWNRPFFKGFEITKADYSLIGNFIKELEPMVL